jgi:hypothetical protein
VERATKKTEVSGGIFCVCADHGDNNKCAFSMERIMHGQELLLPITNNQQCYDTNAMTSRCPL